MRRRRWRAVTGVNAESAYAALMAPAVLRIYQERPVPVHEAIDAAIGLMGTGREFDRAAVRHLLRIRFVDEHLGVDWVIRYREAVA